MDMSDSTAGDTAASEPKLTGLEPAPACPGCDGSGIYTPTFSPDVRINCLDCDADFSKSASDWTGCGACDGIGVNDLGNGECRPCEGSGLVRVEPSPAGAAEREGASS